MESTLIKLTEKSLGGKRHLFSIAIKLFWVSGLAQGKFSFTKSYKRFKTAEKKLRQHFMNTILKHYPESTHYHVIFIGSTKLVDIQSKRNQKYILELWYNNEQSSK